MIIKSHDTEENKTLYSDSYEIDRNGESKEISDNFIIDEITAEKRAIAEFLEYGYNRQVVEFTTYFTDLKINDIIKVSAPDYRVPKELNKDRFIIKNIKHYISAKCYIKSKIKAVRYD